MTTTIAGAVPPPYQTLDNEGPSQQSTQAAQPYQQQQVPVMVTPMYTQTVVQQVPKEYMPNDYLILSLVVMCVCGFISISTLFFSVPAFICSILARNSRLKGVQFYKEAKRLAYAALILDILAVLWLYGWGIGIVGWVLHVIYIDPIFS